MIKYERKLTSWEHAVSKNLTKFIALVNTYLYTVTTNIYSSITYLVKLYMGNIVK